METYQMIVIGLGAAGVVGLLTWLLLKFGRQIARALLVGGILAVGVIVALVILNQAAASRQAARAATVAATGQAVSSAGNTLALVLGALCIGALGTVTAGALAVAGVMYYRQRLADQLRKRQPKPTLVQQRHRQHGRRPDQALPTPAAERVIWVVQDETIDLSREDLAQWGW